MARLLLNDRPFDAPEGMTLLDAARAAGLDIPTLCHDRRLDAASACRLCEVEVAGQERPLCACATPAEEGMAVRTHTPELEAYRRGILEMLARNYPADAPELLPEAPFHRLLARYGVKPEGTRDPRKADDTHPYMKVDLSQCIECYRCVHICAEVQGQFVWKVLERGGRTRVAVTGGTFLESDCVSCGACADTCPTGAIADRSRLELGPAETWTRTVCPYCGTGCEMQVGVRGDRIVQVKPALDSPVNRGHLCVKGRYGSGFVEAGDRVLHPMVRRGGEWVRVGWDEALDEAAALLLRVKAAHGPGAIGVLGSARATNEEGFLAQKLARLVLGTGNVDCCARVCHAPSAAGLGAALGTGAATNSFSDIEAAGSLLVIGANPTENHPIVGARIKQRALKGAPLVVVDPRRTELARMATVHLAIRPGTNMPLFLALAHTIVHEGLEDRAFIAGRTEGFEAFAEALAAWPAERAAEACGVPAEDIRAAARIYATAKPAYMCHGLGVTEHIQGTETVTALAHLAMLTGNLGVEGGGVNPLRGQNNVQGTAQMGCEPKRLTGYQPLEKVLAAHEARWGAKLPGPGLNVLQMVDAAGAGTLKAMVAIGYDIFLSSPDADTSASALAQLEGMVVLDLFMNETARVFGTVFLPACSSFEKDGTFMNGDRRIQRVRAALRPKGESRSDLDILCALADRLGFGDAFRYSGPAEVWDEIRGLWPAVAGISYERLDAVGLQWPCPDEAHPGTKVLHAASFPVGPRAAFRPLDWNPSSEAATPAFPLVLNTGRSLCHFNAATMTDRTQNAVLEETDRLDLHPDDARARGIVDGDAVRVESRHGAFTLRARLTDSVRPGELWCTFHAVGAFVNRATGRGRDSVTSTPEYKVTAVRIAKA
jgi:formate dehydrogenase major subunit